MLEKQFTQTCKEGLCFVPITDNGNHGVGLTIAMHYDVLSYFLISRMKTHPFAFIATKSQQHLL